MESMGKSSSLLPRFYCLCQANIASALLSKSTTIKEYSADLVNKNGNTIWMRTIEKGCSRRMGGDARAYGSEGSRRRRTSGGNARPALAKA
jgi:hypothetical protein